MPAAGKGYGGKLTVMVSPSGTDLNFNHREAIQSLSTVHYPRTCQALGIKMSSYFATAYLSVIPAM